MPSADPSATSSKKPKTKAPPASSDGKVSFSWTVKNDKSYFKYPEDSKNSEACVTFMDYSSMGSTDGKFRYVELDSSVGWRYMSEEGGNLSTFTFDDKADNAKATVCTNSDEVDDNKFYIYTKISRSVDADTFDVDLMHISEDEWDIKPDKYGAMMATRKKTGATTTFNISNGSGPPVKSKL